MMDDNHIIPRRERNQLLDAVGDAAALAGRGEISGGQQVLRAVVEQAEAAQERGEPWAGELEDLSRTALENFQSTYDV